ncbi:MAG TPA: patatin [Microscillaceae bacterium]|nr:patatin [Microscillaceae bacterium]
MARKIIFWILLVSLTSQAFGQKVALVLSGGGAKGIAHIGVIKALEKNNIPIDYIIGTSMGAVIGGFYAAGYSVADMEKLVHSPLFQNWVNGTLPDDYRYFLYKDENHPSILDLKIALDSLLNVSLEGSLVNDKVLNFALASKLAQASAKAHYQFDSLFVPFRALASDIFTQDEIVLKDGQLADAIRASLNVPLFFSPIRVKGKYLFDGGIYNNFPIEWAKKEFNPQVIIGVNVSEKTFTHYPYKDDDKHINDALLYTFLSKSDSSKIDSNGIYIQPRLIDFSALDFTEVDAYIARGYQATLDKITAIKTKVNRRVDSNKIQQKRQVFREQFPALKFRNTHIVGLKKSETRYIKSLFKFKKHAFNLENIKKRYFRLAEADKFSLLYPSFVYDSSSHVFDFHLRLKPDKSLKARVGGNLASRSISNLYLNLEYDYLNNWWYTFATNLYAGRFYFSNHSRLRINIPNQVPFYVEPFFTFNNWHYEDINDPLPGITPTNLSQNDTKVGVQIGVASGRKSKYNLEYGYFFNNYRYQSNHSFQTNDTLDWTRFGGQVFTLSYDRNTLNRKQYASKGMAFRIQGQYIQGREILNPGTGSIFDTQQSRDHQWFRLKLRSEGYLDWRYFSLGYLVEAVGSNQPLFHNYLSSMIVAPAFNPLQDSRSLFLSNFRAYNYLAIGGRAIFKFNSQLEFRAEAYAFSPFRRILEATPQTPMFDASQTSNLTTHLVGTAGLVYHTMLGPISVSLNYYDNPTNQLGVLFHIGYLLYNKKSLE